jgi:aryl-alcohol dehydrogenase-like predicted oxidoreductase
MLTRRIGTLAVSAIGLGCAGLSLNHADEPALATRTIGAAIDAGITLLDTALAYTPAGQADHNERLLHNALAQLRPVNRIIVSTKGGHYRHGDTFGIDGRPQTLVAHCETSLRSLAVERIDLYHLHWPDPAVPIEESVGALAQLRQAGKIDNIGISNVDLQQLCRAARVTTIASVQNRLSVLDQRHHAVADHCHRTGVAFLAYSPLGGSSHRSPLPLVDIARDHGVAPEQVALAWLLASHPNVIPVVGASSPRHAAQAAAAIDLDLSASEIEALTELPKTDDVRRP